MEAEEFAVQGMSPDSCTEFGTEGPHELRVSLSPVLSAVLSWACQGCQG